MSCEMELVLWHTVVNMQTLCEIELVLLKGGHDMHLMRHETCTGVKVANISETEVTMECKVANISPSGEVTIEECKAGKMGTP